VAQANNHLLDAAAPVLEPLAGLPRVETAAPDVGRRCVGVVPHAAQSRAPLHAAVQQRQAATQLMALRMIHDQLCSRGPHPQYASRRFSASRRTTTFVRRTATSVRVGFIIRAAVRPWTATDSYAAYGHIPCGPTCGVVLWSHRQISGKTSSSSALLPGSSRSTKGCRPMRRRAHSNSDLRRRAMVVQAFVHVRHRPVRCQRLRHDAVEMLCRQAVRPAPSQDVLSG